MLLFPTLDIYCLKSHFFHTQKTCSHLSMIFYLATASAFDLALFVDGAFCHVTARSGWVSVTFVYHIKTAKDTVIVSVECK